MPQNFLLGNYASNGRTAVNFATVPRKETDFFQTSRKLLNSLTNPLTEWHDDYLRARSAQFTNQFRIEMWACPMSDRRDWITFYHKDHMATLFNHVRCWTKSISLISLEKKKLKKLEIRKINFSISAFLKQVIEPSADNLKLRSFCCWPKSFCKKSF